MGKVRKLDGTPAFVNYYFAELVSAELGNVCLIFVVVDQDFHQGEGMAIEW